MFGDAVRADRQRIGLSQEELDHPDADGLRAKLGAAT